MVSQELKISPQSIREWSLKDLTQTVADLLNKNDIETYSYYFSQSPTK